MDKNHGKENSMPLSPKARRWFQFHLITCVLLMITTGLLLGANLCVKRTYPPDEGHSTVTKFFGFPTLAFASGELRTMPDRYFLITAHTPKFVIYTRWGFLDMAWPDTMINFLFAGVVLASITCLSEYLLRRRSKISAQRSRSPT